MATPSNLYPEIEPYNTGYLEVRGGHNIYFEECGNPNGYPILFLHGGPGAGCSSESRRFFNPDKWRIILFDQRGSGRSRPFGETKNNSTWYLVHDIDELLNCLGVKKVVLFGGSWGSTLALVFAIQYPDRISGMILRGIFLGEKDETDYFFNGSTALFFPEAWERFISLVPKEFKKDPAKYYLQQLASSDPALRKSFAYEWARYEIAMLYLEPQPENNLDQETSDFPFESLAIMEAHYLYKNHVFLDDKYIINNACKLSGIPTAIIQGRYDIVCPPISAYRLGQALKVKPQFETAGHTSDDPEIQKKLVSETEIMFDKISK